MLQHTAQRLLDREPQVFSGRTQAQPAHPCMPKLTGISPHPAMNVARSSPGEVSRECPVPIRAD